MHFLHPFLLTLLPLVHNVSGQLYGSYIDKPAISTGFQYDNFDYDLDKFLKAKGAQSWTITPWKNSTIIPQYCHSSANDNGVASINVDVANIRFDDCFRDWTICRTQNGTVSWDNIARVSVRSCFCSPELIVWSSSRALPRYHSVCDSMCRTYWLFQQLLKMMHVDLRVGMAKLLLIKIVGTPES